jgi:hypothetical protein
MPGWSAGIARSPCQSPENGEKGIWLYGISGLEDRSRRPLSSPIKRLLLKYEQLI